MRKIAFLICLIILFTTITPTIYAQSDIVYTKGNQDDKRIALTFDDGPHPRYTQRILDILDRYGIKATFFVIGVNIENYPDTLKSIYERGHEIGNHSYDHSSEKYINAERAKAEIKKCEALIYQELGIVPRLFRPPQGLYSKEVENIAIDNNYSIILWSIDTRDWEHNAPHKILSTVENNVCGGDIILFHDYVSGRNTTCEALELIIPSLIEKGYEFVTVSDLIGQ